MMTLVIIALEILVILQQTLTRYSPNHHPREYTQAAYYLPYNNQEYRWTESNRIETRKKHRKKYNDDSISAEMDYGPKRLQCKCTCKRKYDTKPILDYEQNYPCCNCFSKSDAGNRDHITPTQYPNEENNGMYVPIQYPNEENNGIYRPTQYPNGDNNGIYMPIQFPSASYPSIIYPTFDQSLIDKIFPWLTQGMTQSTKIDNNDQPDKDTATKDERDKYSTSDDKDKSSSRDHSDKGSTRDDREKASSSDDKDKSSTKDDRDKPSTSDDKNITSTKDDGDKTSTKDDNDNSNIKVPDVSEGPPRFLSSHEIHYPFTTLSTYPYVKSAHLKKLFHYLPKKKKCFRDKCVRKEHTNRNIGRYYEDDLIERPTIASYLNVDRRRNNIPRKLYRDLKPQYGI